MHMDRDLFQRMFQQREEQTQHLEYNLEFQFYNAVASGDMANVSRYLIDERNEEIYNGREYGHLSDDMVQNVRYHFVVAVALITRICVEHGLEREIAYTLSDLFIHRMDKQKSISEIITLQNEMVIDFTKRMRQLQKAHVYSIHVIKVMDYVSAHLHEKITTEQIADCLSLSRSYLSSLFHRETGKTLHHFILTEKIKAAAQLLTTSDMSYAEISEYYCFSSQSHFIQLFQKETGYTPSAYRKKFYQRSEVSVHQS